MTAIERLNTVARLGESYIILHKLEMLEDADAAMAQEELRNAIKEAEQIIISKQTYERFHDAHPI